MELFARSSNAIGQLNTNTVTNRLDTEMDIDMDIDLGPTGIEGSQENYKSATPEENGMDVSNFRIVDPDSSEVVSNKIHICGVDDLTTLDILNYVELYRPSIEPRPMVEWIDDTSANIVFDDARIAEAALDAVTEDSLAQLSNFQLRNAKTFLAHPESNLQVRIAISTDRKRPRAHESSRFYMMHPEHDPRERRRPERRAFRPKNQEHRRRRRMDMRQGFSAPMIDDVCGRGNSRRNSVSSYSSSASRPRRCSRPDERGVPRRRGDRSASPSRRADRNGYRSRDRTPPPRYHKRDPNPYPAANSDKELFPARIPSNFGQRIATSSSLVQGKEVLVNKITASNMKKELFPLKSGVNGHRRSLAFDAADETADLFATGMTVPFTDGSVDCKEGSSTGSDDRLRARSAAGPVLSKPTTKQSGFSIQGFANKAQDAGFVIRGLAVDGPSARVKELFPPKTGVGNQGKELFAAKVISGARRKKAVDMFAD